MVWPKHDGKEAMPGGKIPAERDVMMCRMAMMQMMMDREAANPVPRK